MSNARKTDFIVRELLAEEKRTLYYVTPTTATFEYIRSIVAKEKGIFQMLTKASFVMKDAREFKVVSAYDNPEIALAEATSDIAVAIDPYCAHDKALIWREALKAREIRETMEPVI